MPALRRRLAGRLLAVGAGLALVAACSSGPQPDPDVEPSFELSADGRTRTVSHALGTVEVPAQPQRVVVAHPVIDLDPVLALGVEPVGGPAYDDRSFGVPGYLAERIGGDYTVTGSLQSPSIEAVAALEPDVIVAAANDIGDLYDELSEIAPVVAFFHEQPRWREYLQLVARALGREEVADRVLASYDARVGEVAAQVGDPAAVSVSVVRVRSEGLRAIRAGSFSGSVLADVGFTRPAGQAEAGDRPFEDVSLEQVAELDADVMFLFGARDGADEELARVSASELWQRLDVVRAGAVVEVPADHWFVGGPLAAGLILDDVAGAFDPAP